MTSPERKAEAIQLYRELVDEGDPHPVAFMCRALGISRATAHRWLVEARCTGELVDSGHRPRSARFGRGKSWLACETCLTPWPRGLVDLDGLRS